MNTACLVLPPRIARMATPMLKALYHIPFPSHTEAIMNITYPDWHALQIVPLELHLQEVVAANVH